jgi:hypothetical protein
MDSEQMMGFLLKKMRAMREKMVARHNKMVADLSGHGT